MTGADKELADLKSSLQDTQPVGSLANCTKTVDQAKAVLTFVEAIADKTLRATVSLTAGRGRGKSAALGISIAAAVAYGYSNIFITSPSPENLKTLFEFIFKGFDALGYEEHLDYDVIQSTNPAFQKAIVRVNVFRDHRQTIQVRKRRWLVMRGGVNIRFLKHPIPTPFLLHSSSPLPQYIQPQDHYVLSQAELLVIDEAAAIPLPQVKKLLGPYLVFMASTINGYEGTGRSLSLKLLKQLREQTHSSSSGGGGGRDSTAIVNRDGSEAKPTSSTSSSSSSGGLSSRTLREIQLSTPIRYKAQDPIESWLNLLLCLDCCNPSSDSTTSKALPLYSGIPLTGSGKNGCPHPTACELFYVNRDTLFSFHPVSETFLQRMMSLYVASHYKNSPNDLQLMR